MSIPFYLISSLLAAGIYLNRTGKQSRKIEKQRERIELEEKPSDKNIYHSERYYDTWNQEFEKATTNWKKSLDPINENIIPRFYNEMQTNQELSPGLQSYLEKRGSRLRYLQEKTDRKSFINEGGNEVGIDESPMFNPLSSQNGVDTDKEEFLGMDPDNARQQIEQFQVTNRKNGSSSGRYATGGPTKQEHFGMFSLHGPRNSNNPTVHSNMVPFFKGHLTQNMDPMANQSLLERFTGQTNSATELRSQPKREIPSLADRSPGQTYIYGTPSDNVYQRDRYQTSTLKTNVTPTEQIRVGPGISNTYDWKPRDGFQTSYRPPFRNVDELRVNPKNVYGGRLLPGQEMVQNRGQIGQVAKRHPDTFYVNDPRRYFTTTGSYTAPAVRENVVAYKQNREDTSVDYTGIAGQGSTVGPYTGVYLEGSHISKHNGGCSPMAPGAPLLSQVQHSDKNQLPSTSQYTQVNNSELNKPRKYLYDEAKPTIKEGTHVRNYMGQAGNEAIMESQVRPYDEAKPTIKEGTHVMGYTGQVGNPEQVKHQKYLYDKARPTIKEGTHVMGYQGQVGNPEQIKHKKYLYDKARPTIKEGTHVMGYQGQVGNPEQVKHQKYLYDKARPTIKENTHVMGYQGQVGNPEQVKHQKYLYDKARPTIKENTHVMGYQGQVGNPEQIKQQKYLYDKARPTIKENTHVLGYQGQVGNPEQIKQQKYLYDKARPTIKEGTHVMGYQGQVGNKEQIKTRKYLYDKAKPTIKEGTHVLGYQGQAGQGEINKTRKYLYDKARPTVKEGTHVVNYMGQVGQGEVEKQRKYLYDKARPTIKEGTHVINYMGSGGTTETSQARSYEAEYNATTNNNQENLLENRTYGPNKSTNINVGACDINMQIKQRTGYDITKYGPNENRLYTSIPNIGDNFQNSTSQNQRDQPGIRQPEDFVVSQFQRNPYSQSLNSAPRVTSPFTRGEIPFENC